MTNKQSWGDNWKKEFIKLMEYKTDEEIGIKFISQLLTSKSEQMEREVQVRVMNEDNPQYVLGWNACRYLCLEILKK